MFSSVFTDEQMHWGNFKKKIEQDVGWTNAYYCCQTQLIDLAKDRLYEVLSKEDIDDSTVISAYDKVMKYSLAEQSKATDNDKDIVSSDEYSTLSIASTNDYTFNYIKFIFYSQEKTRTKIRA